MDEIMQMINNVAFPIVAYFLLFWFVNATMEKFESVVTDLSDSVNELRALIMSLHNIGGDINA